MQKGKVSNSLTHSLTLLFVQTFMGHLLGAGAVFDPQDTKMKNCLNNNDNIYKYLLPGSRASQGALVVKNRLPMQETSETQV